MGPEPVPHRMHPPAAFARRTPDSDIGDIGFRLRRPANIKAFRTCVKLFSLLQNCSSRRDVPTSPFEANGQQELPSAGIALSTRPTVLLCRSLAVHAGPRNAYFDRNEGAR